MKISDFTKNIILGSFTLTALLLFVWFLAYLRPVVGDQGKTLHVRFTNIDKVTVGTRVTFAGSPVGEVVTIEEIPGARNNPRDGFVYSYELTLKVDSSIDVYPHDLFAIRTSGLLGEKAVTITPVANISGKPEKELTAKSVIYAAPTGSVEETFTQISRLTTKAESVIDQIALALENWNQEDVWDDIAQSVENIKQITTAFNKKDEIETAMNNVFRFTQSLDSISKQIENGSDGFDTIINNTIAITQSFKRSADGFESIVANLVKGNGTIGRLLTKEDFYLQIQALMDKAEILVDDINHYGLLFHTDKNWQRVRARRANLLNTLCTPAQFRNFFNDEIDGLHTSLTRVQSVIDRCGNLEEYDMCCVLKDPCFQRVFADLLRRASIFEETVRLYNIQINEPPCCVSH